MIKEHTLPKDHSPIDNSLFSDEQQQRIAELAASLSIENSLEMAQYGTSAQRAIARQANAMLLAIREREGSEIGSTLSQLKLTIEKVDLSNDEGSRSRLSKIPFFGNFFNSTKQYHIKFETIVTQIDSILTALDTHRVALLKDNERLNYQFSQNENAIIDLTMFISAGEMRLDEIRTIHHKQLNEGALKSQDSLMSQEFADKEHLMARFEKRLFDLSISRTLALQIAPQIRLIQSTNNRLVEKINGVIISTIPIWKQQVALALSLSNYQKGIEQKRAFTKATIDQFTVQAQLIKEGTAAVNLNSQDMSIEKEKVKIVQENLIATITETILLQEKCLENRQSIERELVAMEQELQAARI